MAVKSNESSLEMFRQQFQPPVSQEDLAHKSGLVLGTYRRAVSGRDIKLSNAKAIWETINTLRKERALNPVSFEQLWFAE